MEEEIREHPPEAVKEGEGSVEQMPQKYHPAWMDVGKVQRDVDDEAAEKSVVLTPTGMLFSPDCSFDVWRRNGKRMVVLIESAHKHLRWWLGDWLNHGKERWSDRYSQALEECMYSYGSLRNVSYVCRNVPRELRIEHLSFEHHYLVAALEHEKQRYWLHQADINFWTCNEMRRAMRGEEPRKSLKLHVNGVNITDNPKAEYKKPEPEPVKKFKYETYEDFEMEKEFLYPQRSVHQIAKLAFEAAREKV